MITRETWIRIIKDFQEFELPRLVERDLRVEPDLPVRRTISIIGPRRAGKTFFMFQIIRRLLESNVDRSRILYVNIESDLLIDCALEDLRRMLDVFYEVHPESKKQKVYLFLDEVQNVPGWERFVRSVMDTENVQVFVSGSSSKLLSRELATDLRGRTLPYYVYPFNFREFLRAVGFKTEKYLSSSQKAMLLNLLQKYLRGSYPEAVLFEKEREKIMKEVFDVTVYRDIIERFKVKNVRVLRLLAKGLVSSTYFSIHKFYNYLKSLGIKVSKNTIYNYMEYFSDSLVLYPLRKYSASYRAVEQTIPKIYLVDNGLLIINGVEDTGRLMENLVFSELLKKGFTPNSNLFYLSLNNKEVDFIVKSGGKVEQLIQVCYNVEDFETREREVSALVKASRELNCNNLAIITWDYEGAEKHDGKRIRFIPLWKWLLEQ
ncbi:ATP-binding protein [Thermofilum sp.]|uniref:ATP-binding protein n=1 Tax=Thermofilum sp. TaxID=1961369 RepID=UPI00315F5584